jgi:DNA-binding beta-propeller fold protein YncE
MRLVGTWMLVALAGCAIPPHEVGTNQQASTIVETVQLRGQPAGLATDRDSVWVTLTSVDLLEAATFDPAQGVYRVVHVIPDIPGEGPHAVAAASSAEGTRLAWTNAGSGDVNAYHLPVDQEIGTFQAGSGPGAIIHHSNRWYIANTVDNTVTSHNALTDGQILTTTQVGANPVALAVDPARNRVYVANGNDGTVSVIQTPDGSLARTISLGAGAKPQGIGVNSATRKLWVALETEDRIVGIDLDDPDNAPRISIGVGRHPFGLAANQATNEVFVTHIDDDQVSVVDTAFGRVDRVVAVGPRPIAVAVTQTGHVYVSNSGNATLSAFRDPGFSTAVIRVPIRWCILDGTTWATPEALANVLDQANDQHFLASGARVVFEAVPTGAIPIIPPSFGQLPGRATADARDGDDRRTACDAAWGSLAGSGLSVIVAEEIFAASEFAVSPKIFQRREDGTPFDAIRLTDMCAHPRDQVQTGDFLQNAVFLQSPYNLRLRNLDAGHAFAHELGHLTHLGHGNGVDDDMNGDQPPVPGTRLYDQHCDPAGHVNGSPLEDVLPICSTMKSLGTLAECRLFQVFQVEHLQDVALTMPGALGSVDPSGSAVNDTRCSPESCQLPPEIALQQVFVSEKPGSNVTVLSHGLLGGFPPDVNAEYLLLVDLDDDPDTGCPASGVGIPSAFAGAELATRVVVTAGTPLPRAVPTVWTCEGGAFIFRGAAGGSASADQTLEVATRSLGAGVVSLHLPNPVRGPITERVRVQALARQLSGAGAEDRLPHTGFDSGTVVDLSVRDLPNCTADRVPVRPGEAGHVAFSGFPPGLTVDVLLAGNTVAQGATNGAGVGTLSFVVPSNTRSALRTLRVASLNRSTTATCALQVSDERATPATFARVTPEPSPGGWNRTDVTLALEAVPGISGVPVAMILYSATGAQPIAPSVSSGIHLELAFDREGVTEVRFHAVDAAGVRETLETIIIRIDKGNPTITASASPAPNSLGWNRTPVLVTFSCSDTLSGVALCGPPETIAREGRDISVVGEAADRALNQAQATVTLNIDLTPPTVAYLGNLGVYTVDRNVSITCSVTDNLSGVASHSCTPIQGPAYAFEIGINTFSSTAVDNAGNQGSGQVTFEVKVTFESLCNLGTSFSSKAGIAHSLCQKLRQAENADSRGNAQARAALLGAYRNEVIAQTGKALTAQHAAILLKLVDFL